MNVKIMSRKEAKLYLPNSTAVIIRMGDRYPFDKLKGSYQDTIDLLFSDIEIESHYAIQEEDIIKIIEFIDKNKNVNEIIVHCEYGQGRSPAIAFFISEYLRLNIIKKSDYPNINNFVISKCLKFIS